MAAAAKVLDYQVYKTRIGKKTINKKLELECLKAQVENIRIKKRLKELNILVDQLQNFLKSIPNDYIL